MSPPEILATMMGLSFVVGIPSSDDIVLSMVIGSMVGHIVFGIVIALPC